MNASTDYYVFPDDVFEKLTAVEKLVQFSAFDVRRIEADLKTVGEPLQAELNRDKAGGHFTFFSFDYQLYLVDQGYGTALFIGLFIGVVFFVGAGSFLYFRLYTFRECSLVLGTFVLIQIAYFYLIGRGTLRMSNRRHSENGEKESH